MAGVDVLGVQTCRSVEDHAVDSDMSFAVALGIPIIARPDRVCKSGIDVSCILTCSKIGGGDAQV